jgi:hypothetical protein
LFIYQSLDLPWRNVGQVYEIFACKQSL